MKENITIESLAIMIAKGFDGVDERFNGVDKNIKELKQDVKVLK